MKRFDILRTTTFLLLSYLVFSGASCLKGNGTEPDDLCGVSKEWYRSFQPLDYHSTRVYNGLREFIYYDDSTAKNICTEEHVNASFEVFCKELSTLPSDSLTAYGEAYWHLFGNSAEMDFYPNTIPRRKFMGNMNIGLKQAFQGKPGSVGLQVVIRFPTLGDIKPDLDYLNVYIDEIKMVLNYREYI